jgi:hypothetical protein
MAAQPMGHGSAMPPSDWQGPSRLYGNQAMACLRAGAIALVLLAVLALIVLT